jgi:hypothetical protein
MNRGSTSGWPSLPSAFVQFGISSWFDRPELIGATLPLRLGSPSYKRDRFEAHWEAETETWRLLLEDLTESHYIATVWPLPPMMPLVS